MHGHLVQHVRLRRALKSIATSFRLCSGTEISVNAVTAEPVATRVQSFEIFHRVL